MKEILQNLKQDKEILSFIENLWRSNFKQYGFERLPIEIFADLNKFSTLEEFSQHINSVLNNKEFKKFGRKGRKSKLTNSFTYDLVKQYLNDAESILDYGCGKMAQLRRIAREDHPNLSVIAGYDPKINPDYKDFDMRAEFFSTIDEFSERKFDLIMCSFVLHHLEEAEIIEVIQVMKNSLNPNGKILILEETIPDVLTNELETNSNMFLKNIGYESSKSQLYRLPSGLSIDGDHERQRGGKC